MFGQHKARRNKRRAKEQQLALQQEVDRLKKERELDPIQEHKQNQEQINQITEDQKLKDQDAIKQGRERFEELMTRPYKGLEDNERRVLQESSDANINRDLQGYQKRLLAQQGRTGVKGGAAFAQQQDLNRMGIDAQQQMQRDLSSLDRDLYMRKLAAAYNMEQGEVGQAALRQQMASDLLQSYDQKRYQKYLADQANRLFMRI